jgi:hypothetical protein
MRLLIAALCSIAASGSMAWAQTEPNLDRLSASQPINGGATASDENKGQPQSPAPGPLTTGSGGASATNPQGGTPPNMQVAPDGSSRTTGDQK